MSDKWPYGGHVTMEAGLPCRPIVGSDVTSAGLLLYSYVYEARWSGLKSKELCPRWSALSDTDRRGWEKLAKELAAHCSVLDGGTSRG